MFFFLNNSTNNEVEIKAFISVDVYETVLDVPDVPHYHV